MNTCENCHEAPAAPGGKMCTRCAAWMNEMLDQRHAIAAAAGITEKHPDACGENMCRCYCTTEQHACGCDCPRNAHGELVNW